MQRIPEKNNFYNNVAEAEIFIENCRNNWALKYFENNFIKYILKKYKKFKNVSVLDLGCGPGYITIALAKARPDWKITAVDYSQYMIEFAIKSAEISKVNIKFINSKAEDVNLESNQFDLIISHYSFSEFEDAKKVLINIVNSVKNKAYFEMVDVLRPKSRLYMNIITKLSSFFYGEKFNQQYIDSLKGAYSLEELKNHFNFCKLNKAEFKFSLPSRISSNIYIYIKIIK